MNSIRHTGRTAAATARTLSIPIGSTGLLAIHQGADVLRVQVTIMDARRVFARTDLLVQPVAGEGMAWVDATRVKIIDPAR